MELEDEYALSYYEQVSLLDAQQGTSLVRYKETGEFFIWKQIAACDYEPQADIRVYKALQHSHLPGIPSIYRLVEGDGELIIIEEFFQGHTLQELVQEQGLFSEEQTIDLVLQLAGVVQGLHRLNPPIVHGSLLPSGVIVSPSGELKLQDFRTARFASQEAAGSADSNCEENRTPEAIATSLHAASLHEASLHKVSLYAASLHKDIQAIGEILCFLLTGSLYSEKAVDEPFASIIARCIEADAADRYEDISTLIADLHGVLHRSSTSNGNDIEISGNLLYVSNTTASRLSVDNDGMAGNGTDADDGVGADNGADADDGVSADNSADANDGVGADNSAGADNGANANHSAGNRTAASVDAEHSWRRFLPPGFRSGKLVNMAAATTVYAFLIFVLYLEIRYGADDPVIFGTLMASFLVIILFTADYAGVQSHLPLTRSSKTAVRVFGIFLYDILILAAAMIIAAGLDTFFYL